MEKLLHGHEAAGKLFRVHIDGYNLLPYLTGQEPGSPRKGFIYFDDDGDLVALRFDNWKIVFMEQRAPGTLGVWGEPFVPLRRQALEKMEAAATAGARRQPAHRREAAMQATGNPLPSWNDTSSRQAIVEFVESVAHPADAGGVLPEERVAVFDNDGTLWCEKPMPIQADFLFRRIGEMAEKDPSLQQRQPWKAVVENDYGWLSGAITKHYRGDDSDLNQMAAGLLSAYEGSTIEEFESTAAAFLHSARHPSLGRPYLDCTYQPMVELQELYGIPPDRVIGSSVALEYREADGAAQIVHTAKLDIFDDGPAKPVRIWSRIGRRPVLAAGNANGDLPMLQFASHPSGSSLRLLVLHDDPDREFDYVAGAERALDRAREQGWTVVSVKNDWATVFAGRDRNSARRTFYD